MNKKKLLNTVLVILLVTSVLAVMFSGTAEGQMYDGSIWTTDYEGSTRDNMPRGSELYYTIQLDQSESADLMVDYHTDPDEPRVDRDDQGIVTDENGEFYAHEQGWFDPMVLNAENFEIDEGQLEEVYLIVRDQNGTEIDRDVVNVYDPDLQHSEVTTTEDDYQTTKDNFFDGETIYFQADMQDQYGYSPREEPDMNVRVEKDGEEVGTVPNNINPDYVDGVFEGEFWFDEYEYGNYVLKIMDGENEVEYARTQFNIINLDVSITPEVDPYTQEQDIEIRIESNYPDPINVSIRNTTDPEDYGTMEGAEWEEIELLNEFWSTEYTIPADEKDDTYYLFVEDAEEGENLEIIPFDVEKYFLDIETDKSSYLPGEEVKGFYSVTNYLDGSQYTNVDVEWDMRYVTQDGEIDTLSGEGTSGEFQFTLPENARVGSQFDLRVWANDTEGRYEDEEDITRTVGDIELDLDVDSDEYFVGQTMYVDLQTSTGDVDVEVELLYEGEVVEGSQKTITTNSGGEYTLTYDLEDREPGLYTVRGNASWNDIYHTDEDNFELIEESTELSVSLDTDRGDNPYYPGDEGILHYEVTRRGETVTNDTNVQYRLSSNDRVLDKGFAQGGEINFEVPSEYDPNSEGDLQMDVWVMLERDIQAHETEDIPVSIGDILLNPDTFEYEANDEVTFEYEFLGVGSEQIDSIEYRVLENHGSSLSPDYEVLTAGSPSDGGFTITIPEDPASEYTVELQAVTDNGASIQSSEELTLVSGYYLKTEIVTDSDYTTGEFEPGDEVEIRYELVARDEESLPEKITVEYQILGNPETHSFETTETEGTFTITVPEMNDGDQSIFVFAGGEQSYEMLEVNNNPSMFDRKVAGSMNVMGLIGAILILLALIIGGIAFLRSRPTGDAKGPKKGKKPEQTPESEPTSEQEETTIEEEGSSEEFIIEEGEAEPEDQWTNESQIEPGGRD